jgi:hypothetical protein
MIVLSAILWPPGKDDERERKRERRRLIRSPFPKMLRNHEMVRHYYLTNGRWITPIIRGCSMKKYLALYMASGADFEKMMKESTPERRKQGMEEWGKWANKHRPEIVEMGAPLGKTKKVTKGGVENMKNQVGGYTIVQANSHDEAVKIFTDSAHFMMPGSWIEVMEMAEIPEM